jgi:hypothetical protein
MCMHGRRHLPLVRPPGGLPPDDEPRGENVFQRADRIRRERAAKGGGQPAPPPIRLGRPAGPMAPVAPQVAQEFDRRYKATGRNPAGPFRL